MLPRPGASATVEAVVGQEDTALALGSGDVPVLGTPRVLALAERATLAAVAGLLESGETTVGAHVELDHRRPSFVGARVRVEATLSQVSGRRLTFEFRVTEAGRVVAAGSVSRVVVRRERFTPPAG
jgi:fluoroacetyl-CoA thioesterase